MFLFLISIFVSVYPSGRITCESSGSSVGSMSSIEVSLLTIISMILHILKEKG